MSRAAIYAPDGRQLLSTAKDNSNTNATMTLFSKPSLLAKRPPQALKAVGKQGLTSQPSTQRSGGTASSNSTARTSSSTSSTSRSASSSDEPPKKAAAAAAASPKPAEPIPSSPSKKKKKSKAQTARGATPTRTPSPSMRGTKTAGLKERIQEDKKRQEDAALSPQEEQVPIKERVQSKLALAIGSTIQKQKEEKAERLRKKLEEEERERSAWMDEWKKWIARCDLSGVVLEALRMPQDEGEEAAFEYMRGLTRDRVQGLLGEAQLLGLLESVMGGIALLQGQAAPSGGALAEKFVQTGKFTMGYGNLSHFFNGLETLLGPPAMVKDPEQGNVATIHMGMQVEHTLEKDCAELFTSSNGVTTTSQIEWEFAVHPQARSHFLEEGGLEAKEEWPERKGFRDSHPEWCRTPKPLDELLELLEVKANARLRAEGHAEVIKEELLGGRLYTGPMYQKYNAVLRGYGDAPGSTFLADAARKLTKGNRYVTTIHAINSAVIKLSKLSKAGKVYRGVCYGLLPEQFWKGDESGVKGGIEFGFQSTTREREQAVHYAKGGGWAKEGDAMTVMEMQMGMIDRGADLSWLSQYPHEKEVLLPPLTGLEALGSDVEGDMLVVHSKLSLNLAAQTLEQVLSRRRKMLMDMAKGIELEVREALPERHVALAITILKNALKYGPLNQDPEWYNNDDHFSKAMQETLYLQRTLIGEIKVLHEALEKPELVLSKWKARGPARVMLLAGWLLTRTSPVDVSVDLTHAQLSPDDGAQLAELMRRVPKLTTIDVRGNESLGTEGANALIDWLKADKASGTHKLRSLNGVGAGGNSRLDVRKLSIQPIELRILCAELQTNIFAEGISAGMGGKGPTGGVTSLNRRGHAGTGEWQPLIWAAKDNNLLVASQLLDNGTDVNLQEPIEDKSGSCYSALHWAAIRGLKEMTEMLLKRKANAQLLDKHGNTPLALADKKGNKEIVKLLTPKQDWDD